MSAESEIAVLDHDLADDELEWISAVYEDFSKRVDATTAPLTGATRKEILRLVLGEERHRLPTPMALSGAGPWVGKNGHNRLVAAVFLSRVELHRHSRSRTDQFLMYVVGQADAFSTGQDGDPILTPAIGGAHFHNAPDAPHAFLPKVGEDVPSDWEIAFLAITPRNLREDTQSVPERVRAAYERVVGREAPHGT